MAQQIDILINSIMKDKGFVQFMNSAKASRNQAKALTRDVNKLAEVGIKVRKMGKHFQFVSTSGAGAAVSTQEVSRRLEEFEQRQKQAAEATKMHEKRIEAFENDMKRIPGRLAIIKNSYNDARAAGQNFFTSAGFGLKQFSQAFNMAQLSILFFSMAIMNFFKRLATSTVSTFTDMADSSDKARLGIEKLKVGFTVLKFAIGEAIANYLLPMVPAILEIVDSILTFIDKNGALIAKLTALGIILGSAGFLLSQLFLGLSGIASVIGTVLLWLGKLTTAFGTAKGAASSLKLGLAGLAGVAGTLAAIAAVLKFKEILTEDDTGLVDYLKGIGTSALAGALLGFAIGGPVGAAIGAAAGAIIGVAVMAVDMAIEINDDINRAKATGRFREIFTKTLDDTFGGLKSIKFIRSGPFAIFDMTLSFKANLDMNTNEVVRQQQAIGKMNFLEGFGGEDAAIQQAIQNAKDLSNLQQDLTMTTDLESRKQLEQQISALEAEIGNVAAASGESVDNIKAVAEAQRLAAQETNSYVTELKSFDDMMQDNIVSAKQFIESVKPEKIQKLGDELESFVVRVEDLDFTKVTELATAFVNLNGVLTGTDKEKGLLAALHSTVDKIDGEEGSVVSSMNALIDKINDVGTTVDEVLVKQVDKATSALQSNASAARSAASAQERYNRAVDGGT